MLPRRLARLSAERARQGGERPAGGRAGGRAGAGAPAVGPDVEAARAEFPWVDDPALEEPSLSEQVYLELETSRALVACAAAPPGLELLRGALGEARRAAGEVPLAVLLIPDEFQVEDPLWDEIVARVGSRTLERDRAQRTIGACLDELGIPYLDLLPALRAVEPGADGRRHLYHARDTHLNARGNRVVAGALAEFLR